MYTHVWDKYVPVIKILMKRSLVNEQLLNLNATDFERAGAGRKTGYKFRIQFRNGRMDQMINPSPLASELAAMLLQESSIKDLLNRYDYQLHMSPKFQLSIKHLPKEETSQAENAVVEPAGAAGR